MATGLLTENLEKIRAGIVFLALFFACQGFAGTTGKIAGRIIDAETEEPLPFVNIVVINTDLGTTTNEDGYYSILNIPPGKYRLRATYIGYKAVTVNDVNVSIDFTTNIDIRMVSTALEGQEVVIEAEKPAVTKDLTASTSVVNSEEIGTLPVTEFKEVLELQAGVVNDHVRGGRQGEVVYAIDGVPVTDVYDGSNVVDVNTNAIQELQFISGAFNAEYGRANSGYVNIVTKDAAKVFKGGITTYLGDHISNNTKIFRGIDKFRPTAIKNLEGYLSGPILADKLSFYSNIRYKYNDGWIYGRNVYNPWDVTINQGPSVPLEDRYLIENTGDSSLVPMNYDAQLYAQGKLTYKPISDITLRLNTIYDNSNFKLYDHAYALNPGGTLDRFKTSLTNILGLTHILSPSTFYNLSVSQFTNDYKHYVYADKHDERYTHYALLNQQPQEVPSFKTGGTKNEHFYRTTQTRAFKLDLTSQVNQQNQVKFGIDVTAHRLDYTYMNLLQVPGLADPADTGDPYAEMYIPDPDDPNENLSITKFTREPLEASAYIQDKIELTNMVINAGIRFDYFYPDGRIPIDLTDPDIYRPRRPKNIASTFEERREYWYKQATEKYQVSPRLGFAFPITDRGVVHFSYGHFFQIPNFEILYQNPDYKFGPGTGNLGIAGNSNLSPKRTISGEVGVQQALADYITIDLTGYFRDMRYMAGTQNDEIILFGGSSKYSRISNSDFGFVKGIVLSVNKRYSNNWSSTIDYTLQVAKGNASDPAAVRNQLVSGEQPEVQLIRLSYDQRHTVNFTWNYRSEANWGMSIIGKYGSGLPYTPSQSLDLSKLLTNSETKPTTFNMDARAHKDITFGNTQLRLFARIYNLFDIANELQVYNDSGTADFTLAEHLRRQQDLPEIVNSLDRYYRNPTFYSEPRRVEIGLSISWNEKE